MGWLSSVCIAWAALVGLVHGGAPVAGARELASVQGQASPPAAALKEPTVVVRVTDAQGRPVVGLGAEDFEVAVDGVPARVTAATFGYSGPGAEGAARRAATAARRAVLAEPGRTFVVAIDEDGIPRGAEGPVKDLVGLLLDRLGPSDEVAVVRLPRLDGGIRPSADRQPARAALARIVGRAAAPVHSEATAQVADGEAPLAPRHVVPTPNAEEEARTDPSAALYRLLDGLRDRRARATVLLISPGTNPAAVARGAERLEARTARCVDVAVEGQTTVHHITLARSDRETRDHLFERIAGQSGGSVLRIGRVAGRDLDRLVASLSAFYVLSLEPSTATLDRPVSDLRVTSRHAGAQVRVATRWAREARLVGLVAVDPAPAGATGVQDPSRDAVPAQPTASAPDADLDLAMARAADYLRGYLRDYTNVVAEERYDQRLEHHDYSNSMGLLRGRVGTTAVNRVLKSDLLMVSTPDLGRWLPFRDVFEVDGKAVRDREDRLKKLFLEAPANALGDARRITEESARYNLGSVDRTTNVPTLALELLLPANVGRLRMVRREEESVEDVRTLRIDFEEGAGPTLIKGTSGGSIPAKGAFWIDPLTGRVVQTLLCTDTGNVRSEVRVTYRRAEPIGLWLPAEMRESYTLPQQTLKATARYSNFRRFQVATEEKIKRPTG